MAILLGQIHALFFSGRGGSSTKNWDANTFNATEKLLSDKTKFEAFLFAAKIEILQRRRRRLGKQVRRRGCTLQREYLSSGDLLNEIDPSEAFSTNYFVKAFKISAGKISGLKKAAKKYGYLRVKRNFEVLGVTALMLNFSGTSQESPFFVQIWALSVKRLIR
jgi:hypothetical protein